MNEYKKKFLENYLKINYPELYRIREERSLDDLEGYSLKDISIGFLIKFKKEFGEYNKSNIYWRDLQLGMSENNPYIEIYLDRAFLCIPEAFIFRSQDAIVMDKNCKKFLFRTFLTWYDHTEGHFNKGEYAIFPYRIIEKKTFQLFPDAEIKTERPYALYFTYEEANALIDKIFNDKLIMKSIEKELSKYGEIKKENKDYNDNMVFAKEFDY